MQKVTFIVMGSLTEKFWKDACEEYKKRLNSSFQFTEIQLKEEKMSKNPTEAEIKQILEKEADSILNKISQRSQIIALCIEGKQFTSEELAGIVEKNRNEGTGDITFIIGSSFGLSDKIKNKASIKMSMSKLTFPHQLARVMLYETVYRAGEIIKGSKYNK